VSTGTFDYADYFAQISILGDLLRDNPERVWLAAMPARPEPAAFVVWLGCNVLRTVHIVETLDDILKHVGVDYVMLGGPANCCGVQHARRGDHEAGRRLAWRTFDKFEAFRPQQLVFWCPSCDERVESMGADVTPLVGRRLHVTQFLVEHLDRLAFRARSEPMRVALHAHGGSHQQALDADATRTLLSAIPDVEVVDLPVLTDLGRHCASPAIAKLPREDFRAMLDASVAEARARGVDRLVTIYHACHRELVPTEVGDPEDAFGPLKVENYLTLIARSLGLPEHVDRFKRYTHLCDPKLIMAELGPRIEELGLTHERAERIIVAQFGGPGRPSAASSLS
jgi:Fe-S oxidoreductase